MKGRVTHRYPHRRIALLPNGPIAVLPHRRACILHRVSCTMHTPCAGFRSVSQAFRLIALLPYCPIALPLPGYPVPGDPIPGTESTPRAEYRAPKTEGRTPENAPIGFASCMPNCRTALLPNGPMALWPYCPTIGLVDHA
jgi:hypothetical protein